MKKKAANSIQIYQVQALFSRDPREAEQVSIFELAIYRNNFCKEKVKMGFRLGQP